MKVNIKIPKSPKISLPRLSTPKAEIKLGSSEAVAQVKDADDTVLAYLRPGEEYTVADATVNNHRNELVAEVLPGHTLTLAEARVKKHDNTLLASLAPGESYSTELVTIKDTNGSVLSTADVGDNIVIADALAKDSAGNTLASISAQGEATIPDAVVNNHRNEHLADVHPNETLTLTSAKVYKHDGSTQLAALAPGDSYSQSLVNIKDSAGTTLGTAEGGDNYTAPEGTVKNGAGATLGTVKSGGNYTVPDAVINNHRNEHLADVHPNETLTLTSAKVYKHDGSTQLAALAPGDSYSQSLVNIKDSAGTTLGTAEGGDNFIAPDGTVKDSSGAALTTVKSNGNATLPDINVYKIDGTTLLFTKLAGRNFSLSPVTIYDVNGSTILHAKYPGESYTIPKMSATFSYSYANPSGISYSGQTSPYILDTLTFTGSSGGTDYFWDFGDGNYASGSSVTHCYTVGGTYTVKMATSSHNANPAGDVVTQNIIITETYCAAAASLFGRMSPAPSASWKRAANQLIVSLIGYGIWSKLDAFWGFCTESQANAVLNWVSTSFSITEMNSPAWAANKGYFGNGVTMYLKTGFTPSSGTHLFTQNSASVSVYYRRIQSNSTVIQMGCSDGTNQIRVQTKLFSANGVVNGSNLLAYSNSTALFNQHALVSRRASADTTLYNDAAVGDNRTNFFSTGLPTKEIYILCWNNNGTAANFGADEISIAHIGSGLTDTDAVNMRAALLKFLYAIGCLY